MALIVIALTAIALSIMALVVISSAHQRRTLALCFGLIVLCLGGCNGPSPTLAQLRKSPVPPTTTPHIPTITSLPSATPTSTSTMRPFPTQPPSPTSSTTPTVTAAPNNTPTPSPSPPATPTPTRTPPVLGEPTLSELQTPDGLTLAASLFTPKSDGPFPGILLAHMGGADRQAWGEIPKQLQSAGYAVLSFDFRGHGQSEGHLDPPNAATDLNAALAYLRAQPQVDAERIALVGASMGGSASVIVGADDPGVRTVVAISTSPDSAGQIPGAVIARLSPRPFLALGCDEDPLTKSERVRQLYEAARAPKNVMILACAAHANDILGTQAAAELQSLLLDWLNTHLTTTP